MKQLVAGLVVLLAAAGPAAADADILPDLQAGIVSQLDAQGYQDFTIGRTWLGRIVITARRGDQRREIVLNARTGEILGDFAGPAETDGGRVAEGVASSSGEGGSGLPGGGVSPETALIDPSASVVGPKGDRGGRD